MVVLGTRHQADACYKGSGTQCTVNVLVAMVTACVKPPEKWHSETVDEILQKGDDLHSALVKPRASPYFLVDELPKKYYQYEIQYSQPITGKVFGNDASKDEPYCNLDVILDVAKTAPFAFFTIGASSPSYTTGLIFSDDKCWVFDPHSRGADGMCAPNGTAVLTEHKNEFLVDFIRKLSLSLCMDESCPFELILVKVTSSDSDSEGSFSGFEEEDINISMQQNIASVGASDSDSSTNGPITASSCSSSEDLPLAYLMAHKRMPDDELRYKILSGPGSEFSPDDDIPLAQTSFQSAGKYRGPECTPSDQRKTEHGLSTSESSSKDKKNKKPQKKKRTKRRNKHSKPLARNKKEPKEVLDSKHKCRLLQEPEYSSDDNIPLAQTCFSDIESSGSEYKFTKLEQKQIEQGLSTSELSFTEFSDNDKQNKQAKKMKKKVKKIPLKNKSSNKIPQQQSVEPNDSTKVRYPTEHSYCAPTISQSFAKKQIMNDESDKFADECTGFEIDGTFDSIDSEQYLAQVSYNNEEQYLAQVTHVSEEPYQEQVKYCTEGSPEYAVTEEVVYTTEGQSISSKVFTSTEDPMVSGRRNMVSDNPFEEQTICQTEQSENDSNEKGNTFMYEILTAEQEDLDFETGQFVDEFGNQLFFQQVESEIPGQTTFDKEGEWYLCPEECEIEQVEAEAGGENVSMKTVEGREGRPVLKEIQVSGRKRTRDPSSWSRNIRKKLRNSGQQYTNIKGKVRKQRMLGSGCGDKCRFKCKQNFTEEDRESIFHSFWATGDITRQRDFIIRNSSVKSTKFKTPTKLPRARSIIYTLNNIRVCKTFFMSTLDISDQVIYTAHKKCFTSSTGISSSDHRGKHNNRRKTSEENLNKIRMHIESFPRMESQYCRKQSKKEYLASNLSLTKMYHLFKNQYKGQKEPLPSFYIYRQVFNTEYNLSFFHPKKDQCDQCTSYKNSTESQKGEMKKEYENHIKNKNLARENKQSDKDKAKHDAEDLVVTCFDLEQILMTPSTFESVAYYKRKLNSFNFTMYNLGTADGHCYIWHESIAGRGACEIASCVFDFMKQMCTIGKRKFIFYSDNCGAQNKNTFYVTMLWYALQKLPIDYIEHKYLEKGHTQNENDSIHSSIESTSAKISIYTTPQWANTVKLARPSQPYQVKEMSLSHFYDFKEISKYLKNFDLDMNRDKVSWLSIRTLKLNSTAPNILFIQYEYDGPYHQLNLTQRLRRISAPPPNPSNIALKQLRAEAIPISKDKYTDLEYLCKTNIVPQVHHSFFLTLAHEK